MIDAEQAFAERGLQPLPDLAMLWTSELSLEVRDLVYRPNGRNDDYDLATAEAIIDDSDWPLIPNLVPLMPVDERSFACVVVSDDDGPTLPGEGSVVRWHLDVKDAKYQAALLDKNCRTYVSSITDELRAKDRGLKIVLDEVGPAYQDAFISNDKRPRDFIVRPVRIACQNVIIALAAFSQDTAFDGLAVVAWQTCEAPHVATNEANRALTALMLCDAFKTGGTMEVRFDRHARASGVEEPITGHPEGQVPAALRRFARTVGVELHADDPDSTDRSSINPTEARALFRAVTPMPDDLRERVDLATENEGIPPERLYFALMTGTWHPLELDFMLATSPRTGQIISGGSDWRDREARQAEAEICRAGLMLSILYGRLNNRDSAGSNVGARVLEDDRQGVSWQVDAESAAVTFSGLDASTDLPWLFHWPDDVRAATALTVFPRTFVTQSAIEQARAASSEGPVALLISKDHPGSLPAEIPALKCPDRLADLDKTIEAKLLTSRIARS